MPSAEYMRRYRKTPEGRAQYEKARKREKARERAMKRLINEYPEMYQRLFEEELSRPDD